MKIILILGGYGNFGKRIVEGLMDCSDTLIVIAGRNLHKANLLVDRLQAESEAMLKAVELDINKADFESRLTALSPDIVIHTSGPFQGQNYRVALACINAATHYIDLADDRRFVCDIHRLDAQAKNKNILLVTGASSVPGLSSTIIDHYQQQFSAINSLDIAIVPGNKAERGEATVRGILSYIGHPVRTFINGQWSNVYGWMDASIEDFGEFVGQRHLANVDVPDLELFPIRYSVQDSVKFQAGLELSILHFSMIAMASITKAGWVKSWSPLTKPIVKISELFMPWGTDQGAMRIVINGLDHHHKAKTIIWTLYADNGVGPYIPTLSTIIVAKKLLARQLKKTGAMPCLGLYNLEEFIPYAEKLGIYCKEQIIG